MNKELELWHFIADRLKRSQHVMLLVVAESFGSSPGRQGYKMAVGADCELSGSIGGGVMEVNLVETSRELLLAAGELTSFLKPQVHQKNAPNSSGMICSGRQTVIFKMLYPEDIGIVRDVIDSLTNRYGHRLRITADRFSVGPSKDGTQNADFKFSKLSETEFVFEEKLGYKNELYIIGGGHCALALSELMSKMDFNISIFDDRPELNTIDKNRFAHEIMIIDGYEQIADFIASGSNTYIVVMTLGYKSDEIVIRRLLENDFKYFGVLGSKAKMAVLLKDLRNEGFAAGKLEQIHTPIGLPINSRTPEEIAVSIAAEIISVKNAAD